MNNWTKTCVFLVAAAVASAAAWISQPASDGGGAIDDAGERFFAQFDPLDAKSLEIVVYNTEKNAPTPFQVRQQDGVWSLPSRQNYPADGQSRLANAATSIMDLVKGQAVSDSAADHEIYGVIDPTTATGPGAGTRVTLKDGGSTTLADFIIGKTVKDSPQLRYIRDVRVPGRDRVYTAKVSTEYLSTKFEDWIERDLLKLDLVQLKDVLFDDYSVDEVNQRIVQGDRFSLHYDQKANQWTLEGMAEDEALQTDKLDSLRAALDDLQIVDVHRKPAGLSKQLESGAGLQLDQEAVDSLVNRGYYIVGNELVSNEGELVIRTKQGVQYALRFGEVVSFETGSAEPAAQGEQTESSSAGRYVFVTADFDPSLIEAPTYDPVPPPTNAAEESAQSQPATQPATQPAEATLPEDMIRQTIIEANEEKKKDYEAKLAEGQEKVKSLKKRFSEWYYVVSDEEYQRIRVKRADLVTKKGEESAQPAAPQPSP